MAVTPMKIPKESSILQASSTFWNVPNLQPQNMLRCDLSDRSNISKFWQIAVTLATTSGVFFYGNGAIAQIVPDGTLGAESSIVRPNSDLRGLPGDRIDGGAVRGSGLFHSFQEFNVREGRGAYFSNPAGIENILSRVTGNNPSNILGTLGVLGNANLFLLNPNGIIFGPNAKLDMGGSFFGSTANSLNFEDGKIFSATNPNAPPLLTMSVPLGVQFGKGQPSAIVNSGNLSVSQGQNLTLTGGTVVSTGQLSAPEGQVAVAAVPSESIVNINSSAQLLNINTPSSGSSESSPSVSLAEFLASVDENARPGLTLNSNGQVELVRSGLSVEDGDVVAKNVTAQTTTLTAINNLTLVESFLGATGEMNLLAGNTVRVRDSGTSPFVAQAGGDLTIQGNKGIDILALNHPQTPFVSFGNLSLISDGIISGDAHFASGRNFFILTLSGTGGNFVSLYDPIIRSNGDVEIGEYVGASLMIESRGNIRTGAITINRPDDSLTLPDVGNNEDLSILRDGRGLILRAGVDTLSGNLFQFGSIGDRPSPVTYGPSSSEGSLTINGNISSADNAAPLNVQLRAKGDINTRRNITASGGNVTLNSRDGGITSNNINTSVRSANAGNISITAQKDITLNNTNEFFGSFVDINSQQGNGGNITIQSTNGKIDINKDIYSSTPNGTSGNIRIIAQDGINTRALITQVVTNRELEINRGNAGNITLNSTNGNITIQGRIESSTPERRGGNIQLIAQGGSITTIGQTINAKSDNGVAGNVTIRAAGDIRSGDIDASSNSSSDNSNNFSTIRLNSLQGSVILNEVELSTSNTGRNFAGIININGKDIQIKDSTINNTGFDGLIFIGVEGEVNEDGSISKSPTTANNVTIKNSTIDATRNIGNLRLRITPREGIQISSNGGIKIENSNVIASTESTVPPGSISLKAGGTIDIKNDSRISIIAQEEAGRLQRKIDFTPSITIQGNSVNLTDFRHSDLTRISATTNSPDQEAGNVIVNASSVMLRGTNPKTDFRELIESGKAPQTGLFAQATQGGTTAGEILIFTDELRVENGAAATVSSRFGQAGNLKISAQKIFLDNGAILAITGTPGNGANIFLQGLENNSPLNFLLLQNESLIAADARKATDGGNVNINSQLVIALPATGSSGSDITANAFETGNGGQVTIRSSDRLGIYGIEFRRDLKPSETESNSLNDIAASSQLGQQGTVTTARPDVDPSRGLIELPEDLGDSSKLISQSCPVGGTRAASRFIVTGRGGLPPSPSSALSSDVLMGSTTTNISAGESQPMETSSPNSTLVEAQGVNIGPKGEIIFTAQPLKLSSRTNWLRNAGCNAQ